MVVKVGLARESAMLFPFEETRQALYEGAKRAMAQIGKCKPYVIDMPIKAKKQWLVFETPDGPGKLQTKEGVIEDVRDIFRF
ncbi:MAG TPA: hypothetical protein PLS55_10875 [Thermogutta sp.]|nr:hypothetical protein [Thermogutta sp.]